MLTDRTLACGNCRKRMRSILLRCPTCGARLSTVEQLLPKLLRAEQKVDVAQRRVRETKSGWLKSAAFVGGCSAFGWATTGSLVATCVYAALSLPVMLILRLDPDRQTAPVTDGPVAVEIGVEAGIPEPRGMTVSGRVVVGAATFVAPVSEKKCVAVRLVGRLGSMVIDDALAVDFHVVDDRGRRFSIVADPAVVAIEPARPAEAVARSRRVRKLLERLGLPAERHPSLADTTVRLAEAVIVEGDVVKVQGEAAEIPDQQGPGGSYRSAPHATLLRGSAQAPIRIERA